MADNNGGDPKRDVCFDFKDVESATFTPRAPGEMGTVTAQDGMILIDSGPSEAGWHRLESFLRCPQLYAYEHVLKLDLEGDKEPLVRGSLVHVGLAHHYAIKGAPQRKKKGALQDGVEWEEACKDSQGRFLGVVPHVITDPDRFYSPMDAMALAADRWTAEGSKIALKILPYAQAMVQAHNDHWRGTSRERFEIVGVEFPMRASVHGVLYTARIDLAIRTRQGVKIIDHKTAANPTSARTMNRYQLSGQIHGLRHFGMMKWGRHFAGLEINVVGATEPYAFKRQAPAASPHMTNCFEQVILDAESGIQSLLRAGRDPWEWPKAASEHVCMNTYGPQGKCPAWDLCAWGRNR